MRHLLDVTPAGAEPYPVFCGTEPAAALASVWRHEWRQAVIIGDETTSSLFGDALERTLTQINCEVHRLTFPPGEAHKSRATKEALEDAMFAARIDRDACVVAVGGGVTLDLAGFVAATYHRGIAHVNVATTLLAQVDAAIGGKTGVDCAHGKNLVGAFHHPRAVMLDIGALSSLPDRERRNGLAEAVKHAILFDSQLLATFEAWDASTGLPTEDVIGRCASLKASVIAKDSTDKGIRNVLNFGHTVAHALESASSHTLPHGLAVAVGMAVETRAAASLGWLEESEASRVRLLLERLGLPTRAPLSFEDASPFLESDKKRRGGELTLALPVRLGTIAPVDGRYTRAVPLSALEAAWK